MLQRMIYSKVRVAKPDDAQLDAAPMQPYPYTPESKFKIVTLFEEPACLVAYEDWYKDNPTEWVFFQRDADDRAVRARRDDVVEPARLAGPGFCHAGIGHGLPVPSRRANLVEGAE